MAGSHDLDLRSKFAMREATYISTWNLKIGSALIKIPDVEVD
jgi:hypothetical protein